jgi:hypothetical protein
MNTKSYRVPSRTECQAGQGYPAEQSAKQDRNILQDRDILQTIRRRKVD